MGHGSYSFDGWLERVHPGDRERFARDLDAFLSSRARQAHVEYRLRSASGEYVPVRDRLLVERGGDGTPLRLVSLVEERDPRSPEPWTRYRELFERTRDPVFLVDADGRLEDFNPAFLELLGLTDADARGRSVATWYRDPAVRDVLVDELIREGSLSDREIHLVASDGSPRVVLGSAVATFGPGGTYTGHQAILHDITERSRTEESRRARTAHLEERVGTLRCLYAVSERLSRAEDLDRELLEDLVALVPEGLRFPEQVRARVVVGEVEVAAPGFDSGTARGHSLVDPATGDPAGSVEVSYLPATAGDPAPELGSDEVEFLAEVAARLTETARRIRAVDVQRREAAYRQTLVERSQDLLAIVGADGTIRFASPASERLLGYDPGSLVGTSALDLVHPEDREAAGVALAEAASDPALAPTVEHRVRHADGTWRYFESTGRSFLDDPEIRGIVVNSRDVTDRKGLEDQLRHAQKMEAVGRLAGGVAHEFNNLLTVIRVGTRLLSDHFEGEPPEELDDIEAAAEGAAILTRRLLTFSGRDIRNPQPLDLAEVVREMEPWLSRLAGERIEIAVELPRSPLPVRADALQIEQVILNLVENALDAMPEGGWLGLEARTAGPEELPPQVRRPDQWAVLRVVDSGSGVADAIRDNVFEPFFTTKTGGTGLGLATVRSVVSRLGGFVDLVSPPGGGTSVTVCFPRTDARPVGDAESAARPEFPTGRTILVVEPDPTTRSVAERILSSGGYRVLEAGDGVAALTLLDAYGGPLDLLVTALEMPEVGGEELAARVRTTHPDAAVLYIDGAEAERAVPGVVSRDDLSRRLLPAVARVLDSERRSKTGA